MTETPVARTATQRAHLGEARPSQLLFTYGVGSIMDLPNVSVMVMGLDDWDETHTRPLREPRLLEAVRRVCGAQVRELRLPPMPETRVALPRPGSEETLIGVPVAVFPRWLFCTRCRQLAGIASGLFRLDVDRYRPDRTRFLHENCRAGTRSEVLPVRFLVACENGHLDDFPWIQFAHRGPGCTAPNLELRAISASGEVASLNVRCRGCTAPARNMSDAFGDDAPQAMGDCTGRRPQLRDHEAEPCRVTPRAILLGASNLWFPVPLTSLAIPSQTDELANAVEGKWDVLQGLPSREHLPTLRLARALGDLARFEDDRIWKAIEAARAREAEDHPSPASLREPEWDAFTRVHPAQQTPDFRLREAPVPPRFTGRLRRVVLVERLREVRALAGFTRIAPPGELGEPHAEALAPRAPISRRAPEWVPACDVRGEGIFLEIDEDAVTRWMGSAETRARNRLMFEAHRQDRERHQRTPVDEGYPEMRYVLLHSLSHALLRRLAVECGYTTASIRERIYSRPAGVDGPAMAGLLLYTAAPDSEGTLGGLVRLGEPDQLGRLLDGCLHEAETCSSDPLCAEHDPSLLGHGLHGAACHACLFLPETSCERANHYLDRAALVSVFGGGPSGFFSAPS